MPSVISIQGVGVDVAWTATDPPVMADGYGGWQETTRPRRDPATTWEGYPARKLTVPGMFDRYATGGTVEAAIRALELAARPAATTKPPVLTIRGDAIPLAAKNTEWVIDTIQWGDVIRRRDGHRTRQAFTLEMVEHVSPNLDVRVKAKRPPAYRWVPLQPADTLRTVAARYLKDAKRAAELGRLNGIRNVRLRIRTKTRTRIKIPVKR